MPYPITLQNKKIVISFSWTIQISQEIGETEINQSDAIQIYFYEKQMIQNNPNQTQPNFVEKCSRILKSLLNQHVKFSISCLDNHLSKKDRFSDQIILLLGTIQPFAFLSFAFQQYQKQNYTSKDYQDSCTDMYCYLIEAVKSVSLPLSHFEIFSTSLILNIFIISIAVFFIAIPLLPQFLRRKIAKNYFSIFFAYFLAYFNEYIFLNLGYFFKLASYSPGCLISSIFVVLVSLYAQAFHSLSFNINGTSILKHQQSYLSTVQFFLRLFLFAFSAAGSFLIISETSISYSVSFMIISIIFQVSTATEQILYSTRIHKEQIQFLLAGVSIAGTLTIFTPFQALLVINPATQVGLTILLSPIICISLASLSNNSLLEKLICKKMKLKSESEIDNLVIKISLLSQFRHAQNIDSRVSLVFAGIIRQHKLECKNEECFCQQKAKIIISAEDESGLSVNFSLVDQYMIQAMESIFQSKQKQQTSKSAQLRFIKYISLLVEAGQLTYAAQKISEELFPPKKKQLLFFTAAVLQGFLEILHVRIRSSPSRLSMLTMSAADTLNDLATFSLAIEGYMRSESLFEHSIERIHALLKRKIDFYEHIVVKKNVEREELSSMALKLLEMEKEIVNMHEKFPSARNRAVACFFYSEIKNNFMKANSLAQTQGTSQGIGIINNKFLQRINLFDNSRVASIQISQGQNQGRILSYSDGAPALFGYDSQQFALVKHVNELIPKTVARHHQEFLTNFLVTSESRFFKDIGIAFITDQSGFIHPVDFTVDINFHCADDLAFIAFITKREMLEGQNFLILDQTGSIEGVSQNFKDKLLLQEEHDNVIRDYLYSINFIQMVPDFPDLVKAMNYNKEQTCQFDKQAMYFFKKLNKASPRSIQQFNTRKSTIPSMRSTFSQNQSPTLTAKSQADSSLNDLESSVIDKKSLRIAVRSSVFQSIKSAKQLRQNYSGLQAQKKKEIHFGQLNRALINQFERFFIHTASMGNVLRNIIEKRTSQSRKDLNNEETKNSDNKLETNRTNMDNPSNSFTVTKSQWQIEKPQSEQEKQSQFIKQLSRHLTSKMQESFQKFDEIQNKKADKEQKVAPVVADTTRVLQASGKNSGLRLAEEDYVEDPILVQPRMLKEEDKSCSSVDSILSNSTNTKMSMSKILRKNKQQQRKSDWSLKSKKESNNNMTTKLFTMVQQLNSGSIQSGISGDAQMGEKRVMSIQHSKIQDSFIKTISQEGMASQGIMKLEESQEIDDNFDQEPETPCNDPLHAAQIKSKILQQKFFSLGGDFHENDDSYCGSQYEEGYLNDEDNKTKRLLKSMISRTNRTIDQTSQSVLKRNFFLGEEVGKLAIELEGSTSDSEDKQTEFSTLQNKSYLYDQFTQPQHWKQNWRIRRNMLALLACSLLMCILPMYSTIEQSQITDRLDTYVSELTDYLKSNQPYDPTSSYAIQLQEMFKAVMINALKGLKISSFTSIEVGSSQISQRTTTLKSSFTSLTLSPLQVFSLLAYSSIKAILTEDVTPLILYSSNLPEISQLSDYLDSNIVQALNDASESSTTALLILSISLIFLILLAAMLQIVFSYHFDSLIKHRVQLFVQADVANVEIDLERLQSISQAMTKYPDQLSCYTFNLKFKEKILETKQTKIEVIREIRRKRSEKRTIEMESKSASSVLFALLQTCSLALFSLFAVLLYSYLTYYYDQLRSNTNSLSNISHLQYLIPQITLLWALIPSSNSNFSNTVNSGAVDNKTSKIQLFSQLLEQFSNLIDSEIVSASVNSNFPQSFSDSLSRLRDEDLCSQIDYSDVFLAYNNFFQEQICQRAMQSSLTKGLVSTLFQFKNTFSHLSSLSFRMDEEQLQSSFIEAILVIDNIFDVLSSQLLDTLISMLHSQVVLVLAASTTTFLVLLSFNGIFSFTSRRRMIQQDILSRNIIFLMPQFNLYADARFFMHFMAHMSHYEIIQDQDKSLKG